MAMRQARRVGRIRIGVVGRMLFVRDGSHFSTPSLDRGYANLSKPLVFT
jgi:hypothetical protein